MMKKKIAFFVNAMYGGGAEKVAQIVLHNIDQERYDVTLISLKEEILNELYPKDIKYRYILKNIDLARSKRVRSFVKRYNKLRLLVFENFSPRIFRRLFIRRTYDVEIAFIEGQATRVVAGGDAKKKLAWIHTDMELNPWADIVFRSKEEQAECYAKFDCVVSVSKGAKEAVDRLFPSKKSVVIYNPIDKVEIEEKSTLFLPEREKDPLLFVSCGRLTPQKGYGRLLSIAEKLVEEGFDFRLWIVGEGNERKHLENLIKERKLEHIVTLHGYQTNPYPYIAAADWFVCSSLVEGYSMVVAEALVLGKPTISVQCAEMGQLLGDNNEWGIIVENEDIALLNGMREILKDRDLLTKYQTQATIRGAKFSIEQSMNEIHKMIGDD